MPKGKTFGIELCFASSFKQLKSLVLPFKINRANVACAGPLKGKAAIFINGPVFLTQDQHRRKAILLHELGHIMLGHLIECENEKTKPKHQLEFESDEFAFTAAIVHRMERVKKAVLDRGIDWLASDKTDPITNMKKAAAALLLDSIKEYYERNNGAFIVTQTDKEIMACIRKIFKYKEEYLKEKTHVTIKQPAIRHGSIQPFTPAH